MLLLKYLLVISLTLFGASNALNDVDEMYSIFFTQMEIVIKSIYLLKDRVDNLSEKVQQKITDLEVTPVKIDENERKTLTNALNTLKDSEENETKLFSNELNSANATEKLEDQENVTTNVLSSDVHINKLPEIVSCSEDPSPIDCRAATKCSQTSGYYKIFIEVNNKSKEILVFCDAETDGGGWLSILRRNDGSVNFTRNWSDYANGFGNVESEYWLGLDNIHALTNNNGRQELYVYIENWKGESRFARYDNFVVDNASENYQLQSLGNYTGTAGDSLGYSLHARFSTIDRDNHRGIVDCPNQYKAGWWFYNAAYAVPTGQYLGNKTGMFGMEWYHFGGIRYSHKIMNLMIRPL